MRLRGRRAALARDRKEVDGAFSDILGARPDCDTIPIDPVVEVAFSALGLDGKGIVLKGARIGIRRVTLVGIPSRIWHTPALKADLLRLRRRALQAGARVMLIPQASALRMPLLGNSRLVLEALNVRVADSDRASVLQTLREGPATLAECASSGSTTRGREAALWLISLGVAEYAPGADLRSSSIRLSLR